MRSILVIQTAFIGDAILATSVLEKLHAQFPEAAIDLLVRNGNESLFQGHPFLRQVIVRDKRQGKAKSLWQTLRRIRRERYELVVNLHRFLSSGLLAGFSRGRHICGFRQNPLSWRYHHRVEHRIGESGAYRHEVDRNQEAIAHLAPGAPGPVRLYPSAAAYDKVRRDSPYVCIAPTSVWFTKQWPAAKWQELIDLIDPQTTVLLLGAPGDRDGCEAIAAGSHHPRVEVLAGQLSLLESAALMQGAEMNYVNDSAPLHLCSAMEAAVTAVFCSTVPDFGFGPLGARARVVEHAGELPCRPCGLHGYRACPKGHFRCADIPAEMVWGKE